MYERFFGFKRRPFLAVPDAESFFCASSIEDARLTIDRIIQHGSGISLLIGESGMGKTLLLRILQRQLSEKSSVALFSNGHLKTPHAFLQQLLFELKEPFDGSDEGELRLRIINFVRHRSISGIVLLVDESQFLSQSVLQEICSLANYDDGMNPLFRVVLAGTISLEEELAAPQLAALEQRIVSRSYLDSFSREETAQYVAWQVAVALGSQFSQANKICENDKNDGNSSNGESDKNEKNNKNGKIEEICKIGEINKTSENKENESRFSSNQNDVKNERIHRIDTSHVLSGPIFAESAKRKIYELTLGCPRLINQLCDSVLHYAAERGHRQVNDSLIQVAWSNLQQFEIDSAFPNNSENGKMVKADKLMSEAIPTESVEEIIARKKKTLKIKTFDTAIEFGVLDESKHSQKIYLNDAETNHDTSNDGASNVQIDVVKSMSESAIETKSIANVTEERELEVRTEIASIFRSEYKPPYPEEDDEEWHAESEMTSKSWQTGSVSETTDESQFAALSKWEQIKLTPIDENHAVANSESDNSKIACLETENYDEIASDERCSDGTKFLASNSSEIDHSIDADIPKMMALEITSPVLLLEHTKLEVGICQQSSDFVAEKNESSSTLQADLASLDVIVDHFSTDSTDTDSINTDSTNFHKFDPPIAEASIEEIDMNSETLAQYGATILEGRPPFVRKEPKHAYQTTESAPESISAKQHAEFEAASQNNIKLFWSTAQKLQSGFGTAYRNFIEQNNFHYTNQLETFHQQFESTTLFKSCAVLPSSGHQITANWQISSDDLLLRKIVLQKDNEKEDTNASVQETSNNKFDSDSVLIQQIVPVLSEIEPEDMHIGSLVPPPHLPEMESLRIVQTAMETTVSTYMESCRTRTEEAFDEVFDEIVAVGGNVVSLEELFRSELIAETRRSLVAAQKVENWKAKSPEMPIAECDERTNSQNLEPITAHFASGLTLQSDFEAKIEDVVRRILSAATKIEKAADVSETAGMYLKKTAEFVETEVQTALPTYIDLFHELSTFQQTITSEFHRIQKESYSKNESYSNNGSETHNFSSDFCSENANFPKKSSTNTMQTKGMNVNISDLSDTAFSESSPKSKNEQKVEQKIRLLPFPKRPNFNIPKMGSFYSATEKEVVDENAASREDQSIDVRSLFQ
ncbi:MAG: ExeA family protein [Thermoguttaceae bacterium]